MPPGYLAPACLYARGGPWRLLLITGNAGEAASPPSALRCYRSSQRGPTGECGLCGRAGGPTAVASQSVAGRNPLSACSAAWVGRHAFSPALHQWQGSDAPGTRLFSVLRSEAAFWNPATSAVLHSHFPGSGQDFASVRTGWACFRRCSLSKVPPSLSAPSHAPVLSLVGQHGNPSPRGQANWLVPHLTRVPRLEWRLSAVSARPPTHGHVCWSSIPTRSDVRRF